MTDLTFNDMVSQLTETHPVGVDRDMGREYVNVDGLLVQLRAAFFEGMGSSGGSQKGSKLPLAAGAFDLLHEITTQASEALASVDKRPTPLGQAEDYVKAWAELTDEGKRVVVSVKVTDNGRVFVELREYTSVQLAASWFKKVSDFFDPPKRIEITAECPNCGVRRLPRTLDGVVIDTPAFWMRVDRQSGNVVAFECDACALDWPKPMFESVARMIGALGPDESLGDVLSKLLER